MQARAWVDTHTQARDRVTAAEDQWLESRALPTLFLSHRENERNLIFSFNSAFDFEVIVDSHAAVRNNTEMLHTLHLFAPKVTSCLTRTRPGVTLTWFTDLLIGPVNMHSFACIEFCELLPHLELPAAITMFRMEDGFLTSGIAPATPAMLSSLSSLASSAPYLNPWQSLISSVYNFACSRMLYKWNQIVYNF